MSNSSYIRATSAWLNSFIISYEICPFAQRERDRDSIRYRLIEGDDLAMALEALIAECRLLDDHADIETTLIIFADALAQFDDFLDFLAMAEQLLIDQGYEGIYQLASFHPDYCFADSDDNDAANYTNRSPYPMLHLIREVSIEKALRHYADPDAIPERNIALTRQMGPEKLAAILKACYQA